MELNFDKLFKYTLMAMKINGSHPSIEKNKKWLLLTLLTNITNYLIFILFIYNIICHDMKNNDFSKICQNGCLIVVYEVITYQYWIIIWKGNILKELFKTMKKDYEEAQQLTADEQKAILSYALQGAYVGKQWIVQPTCTVTAFFMKSIVLTAYYYIINQFQMVHFYDVKYPTFLEERKDYLPIYLTLYSLFLFFAIYTGLVFISTVPWGPIFMLHACGKLDVLSARLDKLFVGRKDVVAELRSIVVKLQEIKSFINKIEDCVRLTYQITFTGASIVLPITVYEVIEAFSVGEISLEFMSFITGSVLIISSPCYYSEILLAKGEQFRVAVYSCGWEHTYDPRVRKLLSLLLQQASQPVAIRTMFKTVCLDTLTELFHQSYAIFNLLNAMWN